jgi:hypothetical protein
MSGQISVIRKKKPREKHAKKRENHPALIGFKGIIFR